MSVPAVEIHQLDKRFDGVVAVQGLSFSVQRGEIFGLLGPNGAGKTTTIRILMDIIKPDAGTVRVLGDAPGAARQRVGYLPEERGLYRSLRVDECLVYLAELKGMPRAQARQRADELLTRFELAAWSRAKVQELSRGMQQKVQVIASIMHDPALVILDEPFQGLDPVNAEMVRALIRDLRDAGKAIILSAHEMHQVEMLCERIALIDHGRIVLYGRLDELKERFAPNALVIRPPQSFDDWPEVVRTRTQAGEQTIYLQDSNDPRAFLRKLLERGFPLDQFERATISLEEIFVMAVKRENP